jgi:hypothetical protein
LPASFRDASVGADDAMPGDRFVRGRQDAPNEAGRAGIDIAVGADEPLWDRAHAVDDARGP